MPKERQMRMGKAARYAEYKQLEEEKLFAGVKKLVSFDFGSPYGHHKIKREVCHFLSFSQIILPLPNSNFSNYKVYGSSIYNMFPKIKPICGVSTLLSPIILKIVLKCKETHK